VVKNQPEMAGVGRVLQSERRYYDG